MFNPLILLFMAKKLEMYRPEYQAKLPRTDHDISQRFVFSSSVGQLLPVYHHLLNPSERVHMDVDLFTRTQPLVQPAFLDIEEDIDVFFVPLPKLYTAFEAMAYQTNDFLSSVFEGERPQLFPLLDTMDSRNQASKEAMISESDAGNVSARLSVLRLFDHLGYNWRQMLGIYPSGDAANSIYTPNIFPYALMAYHAIYYDSFMLEDREHQEISNYNWDKFHDNQVVYMNNLRTDFFKLHYVPYAEADYFQTTKMSPLATSTNMMGLTSGELLMTELKKAMRLYLGDYNGVGYGDSSSETRYLFHSITQGLSEYISDGQGTMQVRASFALEKYLRVLGRANKNYDSQILAHFGFKVPHDVKHQISHIGHFHSEVKIGEVVSTAQTQQGSLGEIAGKGYGKRNQNKVVDFTAPVHGVLMAVYYARPKRIYAGEGFHKINAFTGVADLWNPEFDNLGMQPLFAYETANQILNQEDGQGIVRPFARLGWQYRWLERKQKFDRASMAFDASVGAESYGAFNVWKTWTNVQRPLRNVYGRMDSGELKSFLVMPSDLNDLFTVDFVSAWNEDYKSSPWLIYQGDPFLHDLNFYVTLSSPMSKTGEPKLDF